VIVFAARFDPWRHNGAMTTDKNWHFLVSTRTQMPPLCLGVPGCSPVCPCVSAWWNHSSYVFFLRTAAPAVTGAIHLATSLLLLPSMTATVGATNRASARSISIYQYILVSSPIHQHLLACFQHPPAGQPAPGSRSSNSQTHRQAVLTRTTSEVVHGLLRRNRLASVKAQRRRRA
jgi:hypothetical protein